MYSQPILALINEGSQAYSRKDYDLASSKYADACAALNDEQGTDSPDLLLLYGKALFQSGVSKSGVLGGAPPEERKSEEDEGNFEEGIAHEDAVEAEVGQQEQEVEERHEGGNEGQEEEKGEEKGAGEREGQPAEEEHSDFEAAWDILDLARSLFEKRISAEFTELKTPYLASDNAEPTSNYVANVKKLSEVYDLLGEVSLESENFVQAAADLESCLQLRLKLYDPELSSMLSEVHFKLSLALEFCSDDPTLRGRAAEHVKHAIDILKARTEKETEAAKAKDNEQLLQELEERYDELRKDLEQEIREQQMNIISGILGEVTGDSSAHTKLASAVQSRVNDLSSMVKKRKAQPGGPAKKQKK
ncbi:hypothetical protein METBISCDRAFT_19193 [Metschnikowia bicuspidata]|uniref:Tetratricopeptide SHNi-TPR domain-containing protein n=1 Tax=Metschnikowia bicuspidata TaxID=27322 RepID=A0A4P9ZAW8_9ASCO|nr:hypothetical protein METBISCDRAFT_19193 [Metschnikowia bicuspidata]